MNRATRQRTPEGFAAAAKAAVQDGFRAVKGAPFDGFPPKDAQAAVIEAAVENDDPVILVAIDQIMNEVRSNESRATGNKNRPHEIRSFATQRG